MTWRAGILNYVKRAAFMAALLLCAVPVVARADDITLTSRNGELSLTGRLIGFDGTYLQIASDYGPLTIRYGAMACTGAACPDPNSYVPTIRIAAEAHLARVLLPALVDGFARTLQRRVSVENDADARLSDIRIEGDLARFEVQWVTAAESLANLTAYESDLAVLSRTASAEEIDRATEAGLGAMDRTGQAQVLAWEALVPVVAADAALRSISMSDLARLFGGAQNTWVGVLDEDLPLNLHAGPPGSAALDRMRQLGGATALPDNMTFHTTASEMTDVIARQTGAIGLARQQDTGFARPLPLVDRCGFAASPRPETLKTMDYPLTQPVMVYRPQWRLHPVAQNFLDYLVSAEAQLIVRRAGFTSQGAVPIALDAQGRRLAAAVTAATDLDALQEMTDFLASSTRLSISFRFEEGSLRTDAVSRAQIGHLASEVQAGRFADRTLWLVGFSDGAGDNARNLALSRNRADEIAETLRAHVGGWPSDVTLRTRGFGEGLPMACDDTRFGRQMNRRVEVWVSE